MVILCIPNRYQTPSEPTSMHFQSVQEQMLKTILIEILRNMKNTKNFRFQISVVINSRRNLFAEKQKSSDLNVLY